MTEAVTTRPPLTRESATAVRDTVDGAFAVLTVSAALARYTAEVAARAGRRALWRVPTGGPASVLLRVLGGPAPTTLMHPLSSLGAALSTAADRLVPVATRALLARLDIPALVREYVPLDEVAAMLDADAVVARVDLDAVGARFDVDALLDRVDLDAVAARLDLEALVARLDLDRLVEKVDVSRIVDRIDLDEVVARVDLDQAVDRVDVDRIIARADITGLAWYIVQEIDLPGLLRASSGSVTSEMVRSVRDQGMDADRAVEHVVDRLLHRHGQRNAVPLPDPGAGT